MKMNGNMAEDLLPKLVPMGEYNYSKAKQRASITWLLTKVYNNKVPEELRDPYYRDHNDRECLKPTIVHALAGAEYYCSALANIYADPNYHSLNHWSIIQALNRKGAYIAEPSDVALTETVLIQTTPIKMSAHMAVIEGIMMLYVKETITAERIVNCIQRISSLNPSQMLPNDPEEALLLWINKCVDKLRLNIEKEIESSPENSESIIPPVFHKAQDLSDLTDGVLLCALISLYCPLELEWTEIAFGDPMILTDSVYNLQLVVQYCEEYMPSHLAFLSIEDILYMHSSVKQNVITFLAELFSAFEVATLKCVTLPSSDDSKYPYYSGKRSRAGTPNRVPKRGSQLNSSMSDLRPGYIQSSSLSELNRVGNNSNSSQKSPSERSVPVAIKRNNSIHERDQNRRKIFGSSEGFKSVGSPTTFEDYDFRSRRNDFFTDNRICDDTSSDFVVHRGRSIPTLSSVPSHDDSLGNSRSRGLANRDKFSDTHSEDRMELRRRGSFSSLCGEEVPAAGKPTTFTDSRPGRRSRRNSISDDSQLTIENFGGSQDNLHLLSRNPDKEPFAVTGRVTNERRAPDQFNTSHFSDSRSNSRPQSPQEVIIPVSSPPQQEDFEDDDVIETQVSLVACDSPGNKATSFAELSKVKDSFGNKGGINIVYMTQDKQQPDKKSFLGRGGGRDESKTSPALPNSTTWQQQSQRSRKQNISRHSPEPSAVVADLNHVRLQLEEKRKQIESEKRMVEVHMNKQRQKMGKQAFLQAVSKEINEDMSSLQNKWLSGVGAEEKRRPDLDNLDYEQHHNTLQQMTASLSDLQSDIQKISVQQQQVQEMLKGAGSHYDNRNNAHSIGPDYGHQYPGPDSYSPYSRRQWGNVNVEPSYAQQNYHPSQAWSSPRRDRFMGRDSEPEGFQLHSSQSLQPYRTPPRQNVYPNDGPYDDYSSYQPTNQPPRQYYENRAPFRLHDSGDMGRSSEPSQRFYSRPPEKPQGELNELSTLSSSSHRRISKPIDVPVLSSSPQSSHKGVIHAPLPVPTENEMEPQDVSFIESPEDKRVPQLESKLSNFNIRSGSRTYRISNAEPGSPPRPVIGRTFKVPKVIPSSTNHDPHEDFHQQIVTTNSEYQSVYPDEPVKTATLKDGLDSDKGFYISFDDTPKRPKPQLKSRKVKPLGNENKSPFKEDKNDLRLSNYSPSRDLNDSTYADYPLSKDILNLDTKLNETPSRLHYKNPERHSDKSQMSKKNVGLVVGNDLDPQTTEEMEKKKEMILLLSLKRKAEQEESRRRKQLELQERQETERKKEEDKMRKKEEEKARREAILQQHRIKKAREQAEKEGRAYNGPDSPSTTPLVPSRTRHKSNSKQRPKSLHESQLHRSEQNGSYIRRGSEYGESKLSPTKRHSRYGSAASLSGMSSRRGSISNIHSDSDMDSPPSLRRSGSSQSPLRRFGTYTKGSRKSPSQVASRSSNRKLSLTDLVSGNIHDDPGSEEYPVHEVKRPTYNLTPRTIDYPKTGRKHRSLTNLSGISDTVDSYGHRYDTDSGLGRATPPRRAQSPGNRGRYQLSPSGPPSLPHGLIGKRRGFDDAASDVSSTASSSYADYCGPRLYKQPAAKSNRPIILNAVQYCVFPGAVNAEAKNRVLEEIKKTDCKHLLILFRDAKCQFRGLYSYNPETEEVYRLYGTGPKHVNETMFDRFFKYNSGGKCFSQIHTKHLSVTIDAFTIHGSLWQGKKVSLPNKKDLTLVV